MRNEISYDDKMAFITDFISKLPNAEQIETLSQAPDHLNIFQRVDFLYERIQAIVASRNPGLRPD